jgi:hypothetical protein
VIATPDSHGVVPADTNQHACVRPATVPHGHGQPKPELSLRNPSTTFITRYDCFGQEQKRCHQSIRKGSSILTKAPNYVANPKCVISWRSQVIQSCFQDVVLICS